jgi:hypothetical protein
MKNPATFSQPGIILLFLLIFLSNNLTAQKSSKMWIELGVTKSINQEFESIYGTTYTAPSISSPLAGLRYQISLGNRFALMTGIQYELSGTRFQKNNMPAVSYLYRENITFHKLCLPVALELILNTNKKQHFSLFMGLRPDLLVWGKYVSERYEPNGMQGHIFKREYYLTLSERGFSRPKKLNTQLLLGASGNIGKNFILGVSCYWGNCIEFSVAGWPGWERSLRNNEFSLTLSYLIKSRQLKGKT